MFLKNDKASSIVTSKMLAMFSPLYSTSNVSRLYRLPRQTSQGTYTSGKKCISIFIMPSPRHASHLPPFTLKLKRPFLYPRTFASFVCEKTSRISSKTLVYVAGFERGVRPIGDCSLAINFSFFFYLLFIIFF